jgi:hypothetical protein
MLMTYSNGSRFVCSGTLTGDMTFVTAAHCVSDGGGVKAAGLVRTQIVFTDDVASLADTSVYAGVAAGTPALGVTAIDASFIKVNSKYTGDVVDQNDIALVRLSEIAPAYAQRYDVYYGGYYGGNLTNKEFNVAGFGNRSTVGGICGTATTPQPPCGDAAGTGRRRQADNRYDFALGDMNFGGFFTDIVDGTNAFGGTAEIQYSYLADFDNGLAAQDASCNMWRLAFGGSSANKKYCNLGRGPTEGNIAGGDSGGPGFIDGKLASINSYGGPIFSGIGDIKSGNNSSFGEFAGYVPTFIHKNFIESFGAVPEPSQWAMMLGGFGLLGGAMRRRKAAVRVTFA